MQTAEDYERFVVDVLKPQLASFVRESEGVSEELAAYDEVVPYLNKKKCVSECESECVSECESSEVNSDSTNNTTITHKRGLSATASHTHSVGPLVDIGENILVQSEVYDTSEVYIHIGMGFHVSLPSECASEVVSERKKILTNKLTHLQSRCEEIAAYINEVLPIIAELKKVQNVST